MKIQIEIPEKLLFLLTEQRRYKVARGGRGSGKSWTFARALLTLGASRRIRVLCAREVQKSIKDSVHKLLKDQIDHLGLSGFYSVLETEIRGSNGTEFVFTGLSSHTAHTIKSFEGVDYCWVEEGQTISKKSWDILLPTIRKDGSEIWISYNPELETDETHQRFTMNPPPDCINVIMNWRDNPWFNDVLNKERLECKRKQPDDYDNIWEGMCRPAVEGAIYYREIQQAEAEGRICPLPYNPLLKVHVVFDLGKGDSLFVSMVQKHMSAIMVIDCIDGIHYNLNTLSEDLKSRPYNWGKVFLPHDGFTTTINAPRSSEQIMRSLGWNVVPRDMIRSKALSVEEGIRNARLIFPQTYFDKVKAAPLIESLKRYRRHVNQSTGAATDPVHDDASHGADNFRYIGCNADLMTNDTEGVWDDDWDEMDRAGRNSIGGY
jgi:phage terminase large subunit